VKRITEKEPNPDWVSAPLEQRVWTPQGGYRLEMYTPTHPAGEVSGEWKLCPPERYTINSRGEYVKVS